MTFTVAAAGDSVTWGQGLLAAQKFHQLAANDIAEAIGQSSVTLLLARSGAVISELPQDRGTDDGDYTTPLDPSIPLWQEFPVATPTVLQQVTPAGEVVPAVTGVSPDGFDTADNVGVLDGSATDPDDVDLVILGGGINDVNGSRVLLGGNHALMAGMSLQGLTTEGLIAETERNCHDDLLVLLERTRATFPNATIVVTSYHRILSELSDAAFDEISLVGAILLTLRFGPLAPLLDIAGSPARTFGAARRRSTLFHLTQLAATRRAVTEFSRERLRVAPREPGVYLADPAFGEDHAMYASGSLVFQSPAGANPITTPALAPGDPIAPTRDGTTCPALPSQYQEPVSQQLCQVVALFHPDIAGAARIAEAVSHTYLRSLDVGVAEHLGPMDPSPSTSVRRALARYGLTGDDGTSLRQAMQHRIVDTIEVELVVGQIGTGNRLSLETSPDHRWVLNSVVHSGEINPVLPFDASETVTLIPGRTHRLVIEPSAGRVTNRMGLGEITELALLLERTSKAPADRSLDVERLTVSVNGVEIFASDDSRSLDVGLGVDGSDRTSYEFPHNP